MTKLKYGLCIVIVIVASAISVLFIQETDAADKTGAAPRPTVVAVCNLTRVFADYKWATQLNNELNERRAKIKTEITSRRDAIDKLSKQLTGYKPGSEQFN